MRPGGIFRLRDKIIQYYRPVYDDSRYDVHYTIVRLGWFQNNATHLIIIATNELNSHC